MKESFIIYQSFEKTFGLLNDRQAKRLIMAMFALNKGDTHSDDFSDDPMLEMAYSVIAGQMERDMQKYINKVNAGRKSGETRRKNTSVRTEGNSVRTENSPVRTEDSDTVSVSDTVTDTVTDTVSDTESVTDTGVFDAVQAPVSFDEVESFFSENGFTSNPRDFYDYNSERNWMVKGEVLKNWKSAARRWERKEKEFSKSKPAQKKVPMPKYMDASHQEHPASKEMVEKIQKLQKEMKA
jgi:hypothetical protein